MEIPQRIQESRKKKGISQEQLAEVLGVSRQAVSKWESGQAMPELDKVIGMSDYFGVSTDWLLRGVGPAGDPPAGRGKPGREWIAGAGMDRRGGPGLWRAGERGAVAGIPLCEGAHPLSLHRKRAGAGDAERRPDGAQPAVFCGAL